MAWLVSRLAGRDRPGLGGLKVWQAVNLDLQSVFAFRFEWRLIFDNLAED